MTGIDRHGADVETPLLCLQTKLGYRMPRYLRTWLDGIVLAAWRARGKSVWSYGSHSGRMMTALSS